MNYPDDTFLARWMAEALTEEERTEFEKSDDFKQLSLFMDTLGQAQAHPFEHASVLAQIKEKQRAETITSESKTRSLRPLWYLAVAAAVALLVFLFWPSPNASISIQEFATKTGDQMEVELSDGSLMKLNAASNARTEFAADHSSRKVFLAGEAYFDVRKKGAFSVSTENALVEVLGTRFSVRERENSIEVQCFEGMVKVSLAANAKIDTLRPGEGIRLNAKGEKSRLAIESANTGPSWTQGFSKLFNRPLSQIVKEYERQFGVSIEIDQSLEPERLLTVNFPHGDLKSALEIGLGDFGIEAIEQDDQILLRAK